MAARTVVVVGLGVVGLSTALALARRRAHVVGLDRLGSGHPHTSSTGRSRSIRVAYALPDYARLAVEALDRWTRLEEASGDRLLHLTGQLDVASPEVLADLARASAPRAQSTRSSVPPTCAGVCPGSRSTATRAASSTRSPVPCSPTGR